jgi:hypothetical protein
MELKVNLKLENWKIPLSEFFLNLAIKRYLHPKKYFYLPGFCTSKTVLGELLSQVPNLVGNLYLWPQNELLETVTILFHFEFYG